MALQTESSNLPTQNRPEPARDFVQVHSLNNDQYNTICVLLQGQSIADLQGFRNAVQHLLGTGYRLTSLVAELRCPSGDALPRTWKCAVRPKIGAKAQKLKR